MVESFWLNIVSEQFLFWWCLGLGCDNFLFVVVAVEGVVFLGGGGERGVEWKFMSLIM